MTLSEIRTELDDIETEYGFNSQDVYRLVTKMYNHFTAENERLSEELEEVQRQFAAYEEAVENGDVEYL